MQVKVATWNVNSIRQRIPNLTNWLKNDNVDVVLLQELKCTNDQFPYQEIEWLGYNIAANGQKSYNGVAILSKFPIENIINALPGDIEDQESRYIEGVISLPDCAIRVSSIYVPNGREVGSSSFQYKMNFFDRLYHHCQSLLEHEEIMLLGGDYNVAPAKIDVYDPVKLEGSVGFHQQERAKIKQLLNLGLYDAFRTANEEQQEFSWWDYRSMGWKYNRGMRIDNLLLSPLAADKLTACEIITQMRSENKPSDHVPVVTNLKI